MATTEPLIFVHINVNMIYIFLNKDNKKLPNNNPKTTFSDSSGFRVRELDILKVKNGNGKTIFYLLVGRFLDSDVFGKFYLPKSTVNNAITNQDIMSSIDLKYRATVIGSLRKT